MLPRVRSRLMYPFSEVGRRRVLVVRGSRAVTAVLAVVTACAVFAFAALAGPSDHFTWQASVGDWSNGANWAGGTAPSGTVGDLTFPAASPCPGDTTCRASNDIAGLTAATLSVSNPSNGTRFLDGAEALTLTSGLTAAGEGPMTIATPLVLGAANTWSISANRARIDTPTGNFPLTVNITGSDKSFLGAGEVGPATINGYEDSPVADSYFGHANLANSPRPLIVFEGGTTAGLNGTNGNPVALNKGVALFSSGTFGALTLSNSILHPGGGFSGSNPPFPGTIAVNGALALDSQSIVEYDVLTGGDASPTAGTDYPTVTATGDVSLGAAHLLLKSCDTHVGRTFTLVETTGGTIQGTFDDMAGNPLPDGAVTLTQTPCPNGGQARSLRINYTGTAVTATLVEPPAPTITITATGLKVDEKGTFSASMDRPYSGTMEFQLDGNTVQGEEVCSAIPVSRGTSERPCRSPAFRTAGAHTVKVTFTPHPGSGPLGAAAGSSETTVSVAKAATGIGISAIESAYNTYPRYPGDPPAYTTITVRVDARVGPHYSGTLTIMNGSTPAPGCSYSVAARSSSHLVGPCELTCPAGPITAVYSGDANYEGSTSEAVPVKGKCGPIGGGSGGPQAPSLVSPPVVKGVAREGETLTATYGTWSVESGSHRSSWERCELDEDGKADSCQGIERAGNTTSYVLTSADVGKRVRFRDAPACCRPEVSAPTKVVQAASAPAPGPTKTQVNAALRKIGAPVPATTVRSVLKNGATLTFRAPSAGKLAVAWSQKGTLVAKGARKVTKSGKVKLVVPLTKAGKRLLKAARKEKRALKLTGKASFTPKGGKRTTRIAPFRLKP